AEGAAAPSGVVTELHTAAREGNLEQLEALLADEEKVKAINTTDQHHRTPLHLAAFFGKAAAAEKLLEKGADPQKEAMDGFLPLHFAAQGGHLEVIRLLVKKVGSKGDHGNVKRYVNRVIRKGKKSALHLTVSKGHSETARFLVMKGASTELKTAGGQTALDLCQDETLRDLLTGDAAAAAASEQDREAEVRAEDEPAAKRSKVADSGSQGSAPLVVDSPPMQRLPNEARGSDSEALAVSGLLACGAWALSSVDLKGE
ncbi:unnamed protein product, partial [Polarella glacialis]